MPSFVTSNHTTQLVHNFLLVERAQLVAALVPWMRMHGVRWFARAHLRLGGYLWNAGGVVIPNHGQGLPTERRGRLDVNREDLRRLMATGRSLTAGMPALTALRCMQGPAPHNAEKCQASSTVEGMPPQELQEFLWQQFVSDPTRWLDNRRSKSTPLHPDFRHKKSKAGLWLDNRHNPAWVDAQLATWEDGMRRAHGSAAASVQARGITCQLSPHEEQLEVGMCRKLCEHGLVTDAVDALNRLVQRGCQVPNNLFYRVLKRCIALKDLILGIRVHALTITGGYEGDAFLATHLIGLYHLHGRLEEAMRIFTKVVEPTAYNWATIIFAYARHGEAEKAIRLYGQMRESTVRPDSRIYVAVLNACASAGDLVSGKEVHAHILTSPGEAEADMFVQTSLVDMYAKCGSLADARRVFDGLSQRDLVAWNAMICGYANQGMGLEALSLYNSMQQEGLTPPGSVTFVGLLQACASVGPGALHQGKQLHTEIEQRGLQDNVDLGGSLVNMYAKCGSLDDARCVFDRFPDKGRHMMMWTALIAGYAQHGMGQKALSLYSRMQHEGLTPAHSNMFVCLLQACASVGIGALHQGKQLHANIVELGLQDDVVLGGSLVNMYAKCGSLEDGRRLFDKLPERNVVTWNVMIGSYAQQGIAQEALGLYGRMQRESLSLPDSCTFACLLQACASIPDLRLGKHLHAQIEESGLQTDVVLGTGLVDMYAKCGSIEQARYIFENLSERNVVTWNAMLTGYAQHGMGQEALTLYNSMQQEAIPTANTVTFMCLLQACASVGVGALHQGMQLHEQIEERGLQTNTVIGTCLINMFGKCGCLEEACRVFARLLHRDVVTWNAMFGCYVEQGMGHEALSLYSSMHQEGAAPNAVTFVCLLQACESVGVRGLHQGEQLHAQIKERGMEGDMILATCLIDMYANCGSLKDACSVFDRLPDRDVVTWNAMLAGYAQQGMCQESFDLYGRMRQEGVNPNSVTFLSLLQACASVAALPLGKELHEQIQDRGLQADVVVGVALVNMYAKCGSMFDSKQVFDSLHKRTIEAWNALVGGYTRHGDSEAVFALVDRMILEDIQPDGITFLSVLTMCSHVGLVDKGRLYFEAMSSDYGISPTIEHYTCMMDLLGRAGHVDKALRIAKTMPFPPNDVVWHTLLGACQKWNNVKIGLETFKLAVTLDGNDAALYVLMSNIFASAEMWEEAMEMQVRRAKCGACKEPGRSWWTDLGGVVHMFVVGDTNHPENRLLSYGSIAR